MDGSPPRPACAWRLYRTTDWALLWQCGIVAGLASAVVAGLASLGW